MNQALALEIREVETKGEFYEIYFEDKPAKGEDLRTMLRAPKSAFSNEIAPKPGRILITRNNKKFRVMPFDKNMARLPIDYLKFPAEKIAAIIEKQEKARAKIAKLKNALANK